MNASHPLSAAFGFVLAGILALTTSQASPPPATLNPAALRIEYMPHPRDMVQIADGSPYVVPSGEVFVLTAVGSSGSSPNTELRINGLWQHSTYAYTSNASDHQSSVLAVPAGLTAPAGSTIEVSNPGVSGRAWGYLANE